MKEVCGFVDSKGNFYKTKAECEVAENVIKINNIAYTLENFHSQLHEILFLNGKKSYGEGIRIHEVEKRIQKQVCKVILRDSKKFLQLIEEKKKLHKELDHLYDIQWRNKWWLKLKWW